MCLKESGTGDNYVALLLSELLDLSPSTAIVGIVTIKSCVKRPSIG
jgi:hypothetical protein